MNSMFSGPYSTQTKNRRRKAKKAYKRKNRRPEPGVTIVKRPSDFYHKEMLPNFFNQIWTLTGGAANYFQNWNLDPFNLAYMKLHILGNKVFE